MDKKWKRLISLISLVALISSVQWIPQKAVKAAEKEYFSDGFENGFGNWTTEKGTPSESMFRIHNGRYSYSVNEDLDAIKHTFAQNVNSVAVVWFYDDAADTSMRTLAFVDAANTMALGVDTATATDKYIYRTGSTFTATDITRTTGWHQFVFDYRSGTDVKLYIDQTLVLTSTYETSFNRIALGDYWSGQSGTVFFDDVSVQDELPWTPPAGVVTSTPPPAFTGDDFENGFSYWTTLYGTPATSTVSPHSGSNSYTLTSDTAAIQYTTAQNSVTAMPKTMNKVAVVWFYDDASDTDERVMAFVDKYVATGIVGMGINTSVSVSQYVYRTGTRDSDAVTGVARTTGWHEFIFDYRSGDNVKLYIDETLIATSTCETSFSRIGLGDWWADGNMATARFDDVKIQDALPWEPAGFEDGFRGWTAEYGTPTISTTQVHGGKYSYVINEDRDAIKYTFGTKQNKVVSLWFYDDATDTSLSTIAFVDGSKSVVGLGVNTPTSVSQYVYRIGSTYSATDISRTTGWHEFAFDYTSGSDAKVYLDRNLILTTTAETSIGRIALGDYWTGQTGTVYFDDICVSGDLPWILFKDGFEKGLVNWTTSVGTASTSSMKAHSGSYSYILNEDQDGIQYNTSVMNKAAIVWFYDDASDTSMSALAFCDNTTNIALGVNTSTSKTNYIYRIGSTYTATNITRTTGWHQFVFDYTSGSDVKLHIDQNLVLTSTGEKSFKRIALGDWWSGQTGTVYYDDVSIEDKLPWKSTMPAAISTTTTAITTTTGTTTTTVADTTSIAPRDALGFEIQGAWRSEAYLLEDNSFGESDLDCAATSSPTPIPLSVLEGGVSLSTQTVVEGTYSGKWSNHPFYPTISTRYMDKNWSTSNMVSFSVYSEVNTGEEISLLVYSDNPATTWKEFYYDTFKVNWTGWKTVEIPLAAFTSYGNTQGWNSIQEIRFSTKIFNREPNPYTVLYLDNMQLSSQTEGYLSQVMAARPVEQNTPVHYITKCPDSLKNMSFNDFLLFVNNKIEYSTATPQRQQEITAENAAILEAYSINTDTYSVSDFVDTMAKIQAIHDMVPFDESIMNHGYPELSSTAPNPIQYQTYWKSERALYGYYPAFNVSPVSIAPDGHRYIKYGDSIIETYNAQKDKWYYLDIEAIYKDYVQNTLGWSQYRHRDRGQTQAPQIRFDSTGDAYITATIQKVNSDGSYDTQPSSYVGLLLHSSDGMKTWKVYQLPVPFAKMETPDSNNPDALNRPPVITMSYGVVTSMGPGGYLLVPEKTPDGTLSIPQAVKFADSCIFAGTSHSGDANIALTVGNSVYIAYGVTEFENCPEIPQNHIANTKSWVYNGITYYSRNGTPAFIVKYDIDTGTLSSPVFIGYGGHASDGHNWPEIALDSQGHIHAVVNGHHDPIYYTSSVKPYDILAWNDPVLLSNGNSYSSLIIDKNDNIYLVNRNSYPGYKFDLSLTRKKAGQNWESTKDIVSRIKGFYEVWTHKMTVDRETGKLYVTYYAQSVQTQITKDEYDTFMYIWPDQEKLLNPTGANTPSGTYKTSPVRTFLLPPATEMCTIVSEDGGDTWRLATSEDY